jgi:hypothetical protein
MKGRITSIKRNKTTEFEVITGVKKEDQDRYDNNPRTKGDNGTYARAVHSENSIDVSLTIYGKTQKDNKRITFDIRNDILAANDIQRISPQKLNQIIEDNVGKKVNFDIVNNKIIFEPDQLKL